MPRFILAAMAVLLASGTAYSATVDLVTGVEEIFAFGAPGGVPDMIPTFQYSATGPSMIRVVDRGYEGDEFQFVVDGVPYLSQIPVPGPADPSTNLGSFDAAWADLHLSRGTAFVGPGLHTIDIIVVAWSQNTLVSDDGTGFIRADPVPEPASVVLTACGIAALFVLRSRVRQGSALSGAPARLFSLRARTFC
jgi:hypothetical protein